MRIEALSFPSAHLNFLPDAKSEIAAYSDGLDGDWTEGQMRLDEITGGSPYGATTIAGSSGERMPSENELEAARFQGQHVATIAAKLAG